MNNNTNGDNNNSSLPEKLKELDEKHKEIQKLLKELEKMCNEVNSSMESILPEVKNHLGRSDSLKTSEYKDLKDKFSDQALKEIQLSKGPLKPDDLVKYLKTDIIGKQRKNVLNTAKKYSNDTRGVQKQISEMRRNVETQMVYRKNEEKLDNKFVKIIKKWETKMEESHQNEPLKRRTRKRKIEYDSESASSQEMNIRKITEKCNDLALSSSQSSLASSSDDADSPPFRNTRNVFQSGGSSKIVKKKRSKRRRLGKSSGEQDSGIGNDISEYTENEQIVPEKHFYSRKKKLSDAEKK